MGAISLLGQQIKLARKQRRMTAQELPLYDADSAALSARIKRADEQIALLPAHTHPDKKVQDAF